jgi:hypothetical protein
MRPGRTPFPNGATVFAFVAMAGAASVYAFGFNLFERIFWIDKALHAFTGFAITLVPLHLFRDRLEPALGRRRPSFTVLAAALFGLTVGIAWEAGEWLLDTLYGWNLIKGSTDTLIDLVMDALGAAIAGALFVAARTRHALLKRM